MARLRSIQDTIRALVAAKLGRCPRCIRSSMLLALASWGSFLLVSLIWPSDVPGLLALFVASAFSLLLVSHLVAVTVRVAAMLRAAGGADGPSEVSPAPDWGRREFLTTVAKVTLASLAAVLVGPWIPRPDRVLAAAGDKCNGSHKNLSFEATVLGLCVANMAEAKAAALNRAAAGLAATACQSFDCEDPKKVCVPGGNFTANAVCVNTGVRCGGGAGTLFNCTVTLTEANCKCGPRDCKGKHQIPKGATGSAISQDFPGDQTKEQVEKAFATTVDAQANTFGDAFCKAVDACAGLKAVCVKLGKPKVEPVEGKRCELANVPSGPVWQCDARVTEVECNCKK